MPADEGVERSAILLIALGEDYASEVLKHLGPKEVQKLGHAMAALKTVPRAKVEEVLADFHNLEGWANDRWHYIGVIVMLRNPDGEQADGESLWGVEDADTYYQDVAEELAKELEKRHALDVTEDFDAACRN